MHDINKLIFPLLKKKVIPGQPLVLVREEFGYKHWFWFPRKSKVDVIEWWKRQPERGLKYMPLTQLGEMVLAHRKVFLDINDIKNQDADYNRAYEVNKEYEQLEAWRDPIYDLWHRLDDNYKHPQIMYAHLFYDTDTYLIDKNNRVIKHVGYHFARLAEEKDFSTTDVQPLTFYEET
jgi:hypothetical protein